MTVKQTVDELLARPMNRKVFLGQVGALLLAVVGVSAVLKSLGTSEAQTGAHRSSSVPEGG